MIPTPLDAVIFDMDGLLLDTEPLYRRAIFSSCASLGFEMIDEVHLSMIGVPADSIDATLIGHFGETFSTDDFRDVCRAHFEALCTDGIPLRPGAAGLLDFLRETGVPAVVATSSSRPTAEAHLAQVGILDRFVALVTRSDVEHGKPHPETFLRAAERVNARPAQCLALEDSHNGVRAAAAAGMATIMIPDLLSPTDEIRGLCAGVLPSLSVVEAELRGYFQVA